MITVKIIMLEIIKQKLFLFSYSSFIYLSFPK